MLEWAAKCNGVRMLEQWGKHLDKLRKEHGGVGRSLDFPLYLYFMHGIIFMYVETIHLFLQSVVHAACRHISR
jgi:hypothetical protein